MMQMDSIWHGKLTWIDCGRSFLVVLQ